MAVIVGLVTLALVVMWLLWQYRAHGNLRLLGVGNLRYSPGWVVGFWLIPFTLPVLPYLTMRELWQASEPGSGATDWKMVRTTGLLPLWWAGFLARIGLSTAAAAIGAENGTLDEVVTASALYLALSLVSAVTAVLAILLVRRIDARMAAKHARVSAWTAAPATA
jgi:hypothetical protein